MDTTKAGDSAARGAGRGLGGGGGVAEQRCCQFAVALSS